MNLTQFAIAPLIKRIMYRALSVTGILDSFVKHMVGVQYSQAQSEQGVLLSDT